MGVVSFTLLLLYPPGERVLGAHWIVDWVGPKVGMEAAK
jgi:hypothetical protein